MITPPTFVGDIIAPAVEVFLTVFQNMPFPLRSFVYLNFAFWGVFAVLRLLYIWGN